MCKILQTLVATILAISVSTAFAQKNFDIPPDTKLYCIDSTQTAQPFQRANYGNMVNAFQQKFGWAHRFNVGDDLVSQLVFSNTGETAAVEKMVFIVAPYQGGIVLVSMQTDFLDSRQNEKLYGTEMCGAVFSILFR